MRYLKQNRQAFTLTEMLVAAALTLFVMGLIATAYRAGLDTYTKLRVATGLSERLRTASDVIKSDLAQEHFGGPFTPGFSGPRLSDQRLDRYGWVPPRQGYFMVYQASPSIPEGADSDSLAHTYATNHILAFTARRPAGPPETLFCAAAPQFPIDVPTPHPLGDPRVNSFPMRPGFFYSRWAEITYFLVPTGDTIQPAGTPLYSLRRRERLLAPGADVTFPIPAPYTTEADVIAAFPNLALIPGPAGSVTLVGSETIARRNRRLSHLGTVGAGMFSPPAPAPQVGAQQGDDILVPDVLSFEVKLSWLNDSSIWVFPQYSPPMTPLQLGVQTDFPFSDLPPSALNSSLAGQRIFDTFYRASNLEIGAGGFGNESFDWENRLTTNTPNTGQPPLRINVRGIQIKLRVWDYKAKTARQITFMVDQ